MPNLIRWLVEALNPCIHIDHPIGQMQDRPENPRRIVTINQCEICGRVKRDEFVGAGPCKRGADHQWHSVSKAALYDNDSKTGRPHGEVHIQKCMECGELRRIDLVSPERETKRKGGA